MQQIPTQYGGFQGEINQGGQPMNIQQMQMPTIQGYSQINPQPVSQSQNPQLIGQQPMIGQIPQNMSVGMSVQPMK